LAYTHIRKMSKLAKKPKKRTGVYTRPDAEKKHYTEDYKTEFPYGNLAKEFNKGYENA